MSWRLAKSLVTLRDQVNATYPKRNKASDGTIGDAAHSSRVSQHNPNPQGVVTAMDITHDPANGLDAGQLAEKLIKDPRAWYVIWNRRIWEAGKWTNYSGSNPHTKHVHISTKQDANNYDNSSNWQLTTIATQGGNQVFNTDEEVKEAYILLRGNEGTAAERKGWIGQPKQRFFQVGLAEANNYRVWARSLEAKIKELSAALKNEQNKPPKEVIKTVEKIVEKPVEVIKEVKVGEEEAVKGWFSRLIDKFIKFNK